MKNKITSLIILTLIILFSCNNKTEKKLITISDVPEWSKEVIWYQIFPERFRNGDTTNDPTKEDIKGAYPGYIPENWRITPWTHDWYKPDIYADELENHEDIYGNPITNFGQKSQLRRYGGDLQGVLDKIDYLDSLGVTAIYFNPLNDAPTLHKYDARHWRHIDRNFGPDPEGDILILESEVPDDPTTWKMTAADRMFLKVIDEFHKRGIKVILDYSWNHTGRTCWAFQDIIKKQADSKYTDWYWIENFDDPSTPGNEFKYKGWFGISELPEIKETTEQDHTKGIRSYEGNLYSEDAKKHIFNVTKRWLDPNNDGDPSDGVDGYRLDVAAELGLGFWRDYRKFVKNIKPDAYLLGEVWWEAWPDKLLDPQPYLRGDVFDAVMNYRWYRAARHFFAQAPDEISVSEFVDSLKSFTSNIRKQNNYAMMNLAASHDAPRVSTSLYNKNMYKLDSKPTGNNHYKIDKPDAETWQTLKMLLAQQFTYIGSPHIWGGDEMGMWGADDPSCRKPLIWPDYDYENETTHPLGKERPVNEVKFDTSLFNYYQKLIKIRKDYPVLSHGEIEYLIIDNKNKILAYSRYNKNSEVIAIFNTSYDPQKADIPVKTAKTYKEILNGLKIQNLGNRKLEIDIPARTAAIIVAE